MADGDAVALIDGNFAASLQLGARASRSAHRDFARRGIAGGATYDASVALAAREHGVVLATRDARGARGWRVTLFGGATTSNSGSTSRTRSVSPREGVSMAWEP